jgi:hypothetical protein
MSIHVKGDGLSAEVVLLSKSDWKIDATHMLQLS